ncbi:hypothetical protein AG0111_0g1956 [Alternaria gaisen]|uniref:Uncharacterized protein n=1 Tax=Alternaria gaisen TaxID=167740 RepID=A0ACB6G3J9_9PLEO|nr:hypothetical protein AG0111_0g1956 [Alternaria gaisen]
MMTIKARFDFSSDFHVFTHYVIAIELFVFAPKESERMDRLYRDLLKNAYARGITEYRTHVDYMDMVQSHYEGPFNQFLDTLEIRLDPHDILSPGKSSIWGVNLRSSGK